MMGSDRARDTHNETRQYRRVVQQQGRVVLEADTNEARLIAAEELRHEMLDVIGPHGVPRDPITGNRGSGYHIHALNAHTGDFRIGTGLLYAGGWSVRQQDAALTYGHQPDWHDGPVPPLAEVETAAPRQEIIYLRLREQEVSAVEDPALIETALGGPDTAQRVRLVRRVGRAAAATSEDRVMHRSAFGQIDWGTPGIVLLEDQTTLGRTTALTVGFDPTHKAYIGTDNQMIRVQGGMAATTNPAVATRILWAYNNASALYVATIPDPKDLATLKLVTTPVDVAHQPKSKQYAEVLLAAADLGSGAYVAAPSGALVQVAQPYDPKTQTIGLLTPLPASYATAVPLFVRIWENSIDVAAAFGKAAALIDAKGNPTGLQVELTDATNQAAAVLPGDYWSFAVRPSMPTSIYPPRYTEAQSPDGPREWVCPLAMIDWTRKHIRDCRPSFSNLTAVSNGGCCCRLTLGPEDLNEMSLAEWIDSMEPAGQPMTICLRPGCYELREPIRLGEQHARITIEACGGFVEFTVAEHEHERFRGGLLQLREADGVTLRGLHFALPEAPFSELVATELAGFDPASAAARHAIFKVLGSMRLAIGVHVGGCAGLSIENCTFGLPRSRGHRRRRPVFGGCIVANGDVRGLAVSDCVFRADGPPDEEPHLLFGYLHAPVAGDERVLLVEAARDRHGIVYTHPEFEGYSTSLGEARFRRNTFDGLTAAVLVLGHVGHLSIEENRIFDSYGGFWIFALNGAAFEPEGYEEHEELLVHVLADPHVYWTLALARSLGRPSPFRPREHGLSNLALHVRDNAADVVGTALVGWHAGADVGGSTIVSANRLSSRMPMIPTGALVAVHYSSVTGNVLINHAESEKEKVTAVAFVVSHGKAECRLAACGNVHKGLLLFSHEGHRGESAEDSPEGPDDPPGGGRDRRIMPTPRPGRTR
jgi:Family of unknown function (DUF6519)